MTILEFYNVVGNKYVVVGFVNEPLYKGDFDNVPLCFVNCKISDISFRANEIQIILECG